MHAVGEIISGERPEKGRYEKRHGFTIHSVQGETYKGKIFIDIRNMFDLTMLYTAIARAKRSDQIYIIVGKKEYKTRTGQIYIIESPNLPRGVAYIGSTFQSLQARFNDHMSSSNKTESKQIIDAGNATIRLLAKVQCVCAKDDRGNCVSTKDLQEHERMCIAKYPKAVNKKLTRPMH